MQNEDDKIVDLYIPRKCSATSRLIPAKEHGAIQLNIGEVDANGHYNGKFQTFVISGFVRQRGDADAAVTRLCNEKGLLSFAV